MGGDAAEELDRKGHVQIEGEDLPREIVHLRRRLSLAQVADDFVDARDDPAQQRFVCAWQ